MDVIGVFEPTPFADLTNAGISLIRGDWTGAGLSALGVVPYLGDLGKLVKFPKYLATIRKGITLAGRSARFAAYLRRVLKPLADVLERAPIAHLPGWARPHVVDLKRTIDRFLFPGKFASRVDDLATRLLRAVLGNARHVGGLPGANARTASEFFLTHCRYDEITDFDRMVGFLKGMDLHASAFKVEVFPKGTLVAQYVDTATGKVGQWLTKARGSVGPEGLGISGAGRVRKTFKLKETVRVLQSKAAATADTWTSAVKASPSARVLGKPAELVRGGGTQYFLPEAWKLLDEVPVPKGK